MPQYKKVFDIGTYTGNGGMYRVGIPTLRGVGPGAQQIAGSLRLRNSNGSSNNYLSRTFGTGGNQKTWTFSCWFKAGTQYATNSSHAFLNYNSGGGFNRSYHTFNNNTFSFGDYTTSYAWQVVPTMKIKDTSRWYHYVVAFDTTQATASNRVKMYVDGMQITSFATANYPSLNYNGYINTASSGHVLGGIGYNAVDGFDGYFSQVYFVDGTALTSSSFGEYNSDGIWVPKSYSGSYGTTGFYLPLTSGSAADSSGLGNNWTLNNINVTTSNTTYSIMTDSPTDYGTDTGVGAEVRGNYCTWDPNTKGSTITLDSGNLGYTVGGAAGLVCPATFTLSSGKWFWEVTLTSGYGGIGVAKQGYTASMSYIGIDTTSWGFYSTLGKVYNNTFTSAYGTYTTNDVIGVALDADAGSITFYKNGVSLGVAFTGMTGPYIPITSVNGAGTGQANFGQRAFAYTAPSGFKAVCTANITRPADSSLWFYGDTPDLMWIKNRSTTGLHTITDTVRGMGLNLVTSSTAAETSYPAVSEMNKFGMSVINDATSIVNGSTNSHVYWAWKAGSNTSSTSVTNTDGTITSQVSANRQAGFSIVSYTGTGSNATIGHGLGAAPNLMLVKNRNGANAWDIYSSVLGAGKYLDFTTAASVTNAVLFPTTPTSTVFYVGAAGGQNTNGASHIAYCWAAIPGYSAFGSYTGNGSADGPFVYTGFRPRWIMIKVTSTIDHWILYDTVRSDYNPADDRLFANLTNAESASDNIDILSNGFKLRSSTTVNNTSSGTYIYAAFAEIPFKYARAR